MVCADCLLCVPVVCCFQATKKKQSLMNTVARLRGVLTYMHDTIDEREHGRTQAEDMRKHVEALLKITANFRRDVSKAYPDKLLGAATGQLPAVGSDWDTKELPSKTDVLEFVVNEVKRVSGQGMHIAVLPTWAAATPPSTQHGRPHTCTCKANRG